MVCMGSIKSRIKKRNPGWQTRMGNDLLVAWLNFYFAMLFWSFFKQCVELVAYCWNCVKADEGELQEAGWKAQRGGTNS